MKILALFALALAASFTACTTDSRGRTQFDPATAARWLDLGSKALDTFSPPAAPPPVNSAGTIIRRPNGEWRWQEDGWTWCPNLAPLRVSVSLRSPSDIAESWQRTLYHGARVIKPLVVLNGRRIE